MSVVTVWLVWGPGLTEDGPVPVLVASGQSEPAQASEAMAEAVMAFAMAPQGLLEATVPQAEALATLRGLAAQAEAIIKGAAL